MAVWNVERKNGVTLTYVKDGIAKPCGSSSQALFKDVLAWCAAEASEVADVIVIEGEGVFVRLASPAPVFGRVLRS